MEQQKSGWAMAFKWAIIIALVNFIYTLLLYAAKLHTNKALGWIGFVLSFIGLLMCMTQRRNKELGGFISYGEGFRTGLKCTLIYSVIGTVLFFIFIQFIATDYVATILQEAENKMMEKGLPDDQIEMAMNITKKFVSPGMMVVWGLVMGFLGGLILSLIAAAIAKKESTQLPQPQ